ncbi:MAG: RNA 2',3'-cyclic phosphodiesterase [Thaumarchaeota archaeon]|nr:RNA 2',3'-cyclic phosphodiesterase [Nitrososphaerota archaeon]
MRAFLAFEVAQPVVANLLMAEEDLRKTGADIGIVGRENIHFTVRFFGDIPETTTGEIDAMIGRVALESLDITVRGIGVFPDPRRPRVVWAGVAPGDAAKMVRLSTSIIKAVEGVGTPDERPFHPHITLGRVRSPRNTEALGSFVQQNQSRDFGRTKLDKLKLKSSVLTPMGAIYSDVREYALN